MALSEAERKLRASIAGRTGWADMSAADRRARAQNANRGIWQKYFDATDPALPEHERARMADGHYSAHMKRLTFKSIKARRLRKGAREREAQARREARQAEQLDGGAA